MHKILQKIYAVPLETLQTILPKQYFHASLYASKMPQQYGKDIEIFQGDAFLYETPQNYIRNWIHLQKCRNLKRNNA